MVSVAEVKRSPQHNLAEQLDLVQRVARRRWLVCLEGEAAVLAGDDDLSKEVVERPVACDLPWQPRNARCRRAAVGGDCMNAAALR